MVGGTVSLRQGSLKWNGPRATVSPELLALSTAQTSKYGLGPPVGMFEKVQTLPPALARVPWTFVPSPVFAQTDFTPVELGPSSAMMVNVTAFWFVYGGGAVAAVTVGGATSNVVPAVAN